MADISRNITLEQGAAVSVAFVAKYTVGGAPIDITGMTLSATMRRAHASYVDYDFSINVTNAVNGEFSIEMTQEVIDAIPSSRCLYEIYLTDVEEIRIYSGTAYVVEAGATEVSPPNEGSNQEIAFKEVSSGYSVNWDDNLIVDASQGGFQLVVPDEPFKGFLFDFVDKGATITALTPVIIKDSVTTFATITDTGYIKAVWTGNIWSISVFGVWVDAP